MKIKADYRQHEIDPVSGEVTLKFRLEHKSRLSQLDKLDGLLTAITSHVNAPKKYLKVDLDVWREPRSRDANAYFHVLVGAIARDRERSDDDIKHMLVTNYGALDKYEDEFVLIKLPAKVNPANYYKYLKYNGSEVGADGKEWNIYIPYKETHLYDSKEMYHLICGAVEMAEGLGIDVRTPDEIASMLALMEEHEKQKNKGV